jgi:hypothetical protein
MYVSTRFKEKTSSCIWVNNSKNWAGSQPVDMKALSQIWHCLNSHNFHIAFRLTTIPGSHMELISCLVCDLLCWILPLFLSSHPVLFEYIFCFNHVLCSAQTVCEHHTTWWDAGDMVDKEENNNTKNWKCVLNQTVISKLRHWAPYDCLCCKVMG